MRILLLVVALVLFILAALTGFDVVTLNHWEGLVAAGLAAYVGSLLVP